MVHGTVGHVLPQPELVCPGRRCRFTSSTSGATWALPASLKCEGWMLSCFPGSNAERWTGNSFSLQYLNFLRCRVQGKVVWVFPMLSFFHLILLLLIIIIIIIIIHNHYYCFQLDTFSTVLTRKLLLVFFNVSSFSGLRVPYVCIPFSIMLFHSLSVYGTVFCFTNILNIRVTVCSDDETQKAITSALSVIFGIHLSFKNVFIFCSDHLLFAVEPKKKKKEKIILLCKILDFKMNIGFIYNWIEFTLLK